MRLSVVLCLVFCSSTTVLADGAPKVASLRSYYDETGPYYRGNDRWLNRNAADDLLGEEIPSRRSRTSKTSKSKRKHCMDHCTRSISVIYKGPGTSEDFLPTSGKRRFCKKFCSVKEEDEALNKSHKHKKRSDEGECDSCVTRRMFPGNFISKKIFRAKPVNHASITKRGIMVATSGGGKAVATDGKKVVTSGDDKGHEKGSDVIVVTSGGGKAVATDGKAVAISLRHAPFKKGSKLFVATSGRGKASKGGKSTKANRRRKKRDHVFVASSGKKKVRASDEKEEKRPTKSKRGIKKRTNLAVSTVGDAKAFATDGKETLTSILDFKKGSTKTSQLAVATSGNAEAVAKDGDKVITSLKQTKEGPKPLKGSSSSDKPDSGPGIAVATIGNGEAFASNGYGAVSSHKGKSKPIQTNTHGMYAFSTGNSQASASNGRETVVSTGGNVHHYEGSNKAAQTMYDKISKQNSEMLVDMMKKHNSNFNIGNPKTPAENFNPFTFAGLPDPRMWG